MDLCEKYKDYHITIQQAVSEDEKKMLLSEFFTHLEVAQKECNLYLATVKKSKEAALAACETNNVPASAHLTFDFVQQDLVILPYHARQVGPIYARTNIRHL